MNTFAYEGVTFSSGNHESEIKPVSETPITDEASFYCGDQSAGECVVPAEVCRNLEKNLTAFSDVNEECRKLLGISESNESITETISKLVGARTS